MQNQTLAPVAGRKAWHSPIVTIAASADAQHGAPPGVVDGIGFFS